MLVGGKRHALGGRFFEPTILTDVTPAMVVAREETFGPVAPLFRFHSEADAIRLANDTEFGLAAYFYGRDIGRIWRVAEALEYGIVGINTGIISTEVAPFGGMKESGIGREGSKYGIEEFLEIKYLVHRWDLTSAKDTKDTKALQRIVSTLSVSIVSMIRASLMIHWPVAQLPTAAKKGGSPEAAKIENPVAATPAVDFGGEARLSAAVRQVPRSRGQRRRQLAATGEVPSDLTDRSVGLRVNRRRSLRGHSRWHFRPTWKATRGA